MKKVAILACQFLTAACGDHSAGSVSSAIDSAGVRVVMNTVSASSDMCTLDATPAVQIGVADGPKEYMLHRTFGARRLSDGRIVLASDGSGEIRFYDSAGKYLASGGKPGEGPGEFRSPFYLWVLPGDTIWVGDYRPWRYLVFSPEGKWIRTVEPQPQYLNSPDGFGMLQDGRAVLGSGRSFRPRTGYGADSIEIRVHASTGEQQHTFGWFPNGRWAPAENHPNNLWLYPLFESFSEFTAAGNDIAIAANGEPDVRIYNGSGTLKRIVRWDPGDRTVPQAEVDAYRKRELERAAGMPDDERIRYVDPQISPTRPTAEHFPSVTGLEFGTDGRLWVRTYRRPSDPGPRKWLAFDADGKYHCTAFIPGEITVYEFGRDYLLGLNETQDGVERVVLHKLGQPEKGSDRR